MKKISLVLIMVVLLVACGGGDPVGGSNDGGSSIDAYCENAWEQAEVDAGGEGSFVNMVLNNEWAPDSIGYAIKDCINNGWTGDR